MTKNLMDLADAYAEAETSFWMGQEKANKEVYTDARKSRDEARAALLAAVEAQAAELEAAKANGAKWQSLCEGNISLNEKLTKQLDAAPVAPQQEPRGLAGGAGNFNPEPTGILSASSGGNHGAMPVAQPATRPATRDEKIVNPGVYVVAQPAEAQEPKP